MVLEFELKHADNKEMEVPQPNKPANRLQRK